MDQDPSQLVACPGSELVSQVNLFVHLVAVLLNFVFGAPMADLVAVEPALLRSSNPRKNQD